MNAHHIEGVLLGSLGKRVRVLRENMGLKTQSDLILKMELVGCSVSKSTISAIENDNVKPSVEVLMALAEVLGTTTDYLLVRSHFAIPQESEPNTLYIDPNADTDVLQRMVDAFSSLSRADQEMIIGITQRLRETEKPMVIGR